jgi:AraC-like DNA-binding protein
MVSMMRQHLEIESAGRVGLVAVRFFPWGGYHYFDKPIADFVNRTIDIDHVWDDHAAIASQMMSAPSMQERVDVVQHYLTVQLSRFRKEEPEVDAAVRIIRDTRGQLRIEDVAGQIGWTQRHLSRRFTATVGVTPKFFSRVTRFLALCHRLRENDTTSLTALSHECGFHDQSHFIREFRKFSGFTPSEFFARRNVVFADL